ncbi:MAG: hypothetical protein ABIT38_03190 [Gemmatimonadaceae bacterium]
MLPRDSAVQRRFILPGLSIFAAAAVLVLMMRTPMPSPTATSGPGEERASRVTQPDVVPLIRVIAPRDDEPGRYAGTQLVWVSESRDALYRVTLQDDDGRLIREWNTTDTIVVLPDASAMPRGHDYYWSVDAIRADGRSTTSKSHKFRR